MKDLYPGYDVLRKRDTPSWNEQTREAVDERLGMDPERHVFFNDLEWRILRALCLRIVPQPEGRDPPIAAMIDEKMAKGAGDGYRHADMPPMREAWRLGLAALDDEAQHRYDSPFYMLGGEQQDSVLKHVQEGEVESPAWTSVPAKEFFSTRILPDIVKSYYSLPCAWNEIGFGGPASPRGYVRMGYDRRDPWEAAEAKPGREDEARRENARV